MSRSRFESGYLHDETPVMNYYYYFGGGVGGVTFAVLALGAKTYDSVSLATSSMLTPHQAHSHAPLTGVRHAPTCVLTPPLEVPMVTSLSGGL